MLYNSHQRRLIVNRCWLIYDLITEKCRPLHQFHIEFPSLVDLSLISGYLQVHVEISRGGHSLYINEEYDFVEHMLVVKVYSYNAPYSHGKMNTSLRQRLIVFHQFHPRSPLEDLSCLPASGGSKEKRNLPEGHDSFSSAKSTDGNVCDSLRSSAAKQ